MSPSQTRTASALLELLLDPREYERPSLLVARLTDLIGGLPQTDVLRFFEEELIHTDRSLHFRFVLLQAAAELSWPQLMDVLKRFVLSEAPIQLIKAALRAMAGIQALSVYCFCLELQKKCMRQELFELAGEQIALLLKAEHNVQLFHDILQGNLRHRDPFVGLEQLAKKMNPEALEHLVGALRTVHGAALAAASRLAGLCAQPIFSGPLLDRLRQDWKAENAELQREMIRALCRCAGGGQRRIRIGQTLESLFRETGPERKELVWIWSLPLLEKNCRKRHYSRFPALKAHEKMALLQEVSQEDVADLVPFVRNGLDCETDAQLFEFYVVWLIERGFVRQCLDRLSVMSGPRMRLLLCAVCNTDCTDFVGELLPFFHSGAEDDVLVCLSSALLRGDVPEPSAMRAWELMKSGVSPVVQSALIRRLPEWLSRSAAPLDELFAICRNTAALHNEWLVSWARILKDSAAAAFRLDVLDGVLVLFEAMADTDPLPYIAFFRGMTYQNREELRLVREEVSLILNTLLRSASDSQSGQQLAGLLRELDKRAQIGWPQDGG